MLKYTTIDETLGKTFADAQEEIIVDSGSIFYTRRTLVEEVGCANFAAAKRLTRALRKLDITSITKLRRLDPYSLLRIKGVGLTTIFVAMCILEANSCSVTDWWGWKQKDNVVKFSTYKRNAERRARKHKQEIA